MVTGNPFREWGDNILARELASLEVGLSGFLTKADDVTAAQRMVFSELRVSLLTVVGNQNRNQGANGEMNLSFLWIAQKEQRWLEMKRIRGRESFDPEFCKWPLWNVGDGATLTKARLAVQFCRKQFCVTM